MKILEHIPDLHILETERLLLRELSPKVYKQVFNSFEKAQVKAFFGLETEEEYIQEKARYQGGLGTFNKTYFIFHMLEKASMKVLGSIGFHTWYLQHNRAEIFYMIKHEEDRKKGYASEAIIPTIRHGFNEMNLNRIEAMLSPLNTPSVRLMQKSGFVKEGTLKKHYLINQQYEDSDVYGLLKTDYTHTR